MILLAQGKGQISRQLTTDLADVESRFAAELNSDLSCVNALASHVERYRGKMLRPTLVLVSAMALDPQVQTPGPSHKVLAAVVEMVHMATLVHDDILDEADLRRSGATVNHLHGNETAVMLGDYLISHAYHLCASLPDVCISQRIAAATNAVCEGELLQLANRGNQSLDEATYFEIIGRKTASLCGACCALSATLSGAPDRVVQALDTYGQKIGAAFQIVDDVLDLVGDPDTVGKTLGLDLDKGKLTLPLIRYLCQAPSAPRRLLLGHLDCLADTSTLAADRASAAQAIRQQVRESDALRYAKTHADQLVNQAKAAIDETLNESPARLLMMEMADAVLSRQS